MGCNLCIIEVRVMQLSSIDLNLLVVLDALLETRSVKLAAARVALSPSATSHALGRAREFLSDPLLVRAGKEMVLSTRARELRPRIRALLEEIDTVLRRGEALVPRELVRTFAVAGSDYAEILLLCELSRAVAASAPGVTLHCKRVTDNVVHQLRAGECELALGVFGKLPNDILTAPVLDDEFVCLLRRGHPALARPLTLRRFAALEHILISPRGGPRGIVDDVLAEHGLERRVARTVPSFLVAPHLVRETDYIITMSRRIAIAVAKPLGLVVRKPPLALPSFTITMAWQRRDDDDPAHQWIRREVMHVARRVNRQTR
jgi:DNA-binding transcriptional LysR family regulator